MITTEDRVDDEEVPGGVIRIRRVVQCETFKDDETFTTLVISQVFIPGVRINAEGKLKKISLTRSVRKNE